MNEMHVLWSPPLQYLFGFKLEACSFPFILVSLIQHCLPPFHVLLISNNVLIANITVVCTFFLPTTKAWNNVIKLLFHSMWFFC